MGLNSYSKMHRSNSKIKRWLEEHNYKNIHFFPHTRFIKDVKIDNIDFDGIATDYGQIVLFQCKTNKKPSKKLLEEYKGLGYRYGISCLFLTNIDRLGVSCYK